ncbi:hemolysin family protein [Metabacillus herbersteinensis]|uniref:Hemolysin family protein n=1 Tax=Metabacillus herbersteinensis TaxID=283816 RepID=A0ABV6GAV3_9BACI
MILLFILLLALSAFFSSAETAFSTVNKIRLKNSADEGKGGAKKALYIINHFDQALSTILVGNNLVNIGAATLSSTIAIDIFGPSVGVFVSTFVVTILVLIFGEIPPKSIAKEYADSFSLKISGILLFLIRLMSPITWFFIRLRKGAAKLMGNKDQEPSFTEGEIKAMLNKSEEEGVLNKNENELIHRSLDFDDIIVAEIIKPRIDIISIEVNQPIEEIKDILFKERFSRIPVYEDHIDNMIGILSERDFLTALVQNEEQINIRELLRDPMFVVESMKISAILPELQKHKVHMAIVIDEFGGTSGLITLEDILEEIVGDIWDEHDVSVKEMKQLDEVTYLFNADYSLDDFVRVTDVELPDTSYHTLGGWIVNQFQRIPTMGETFEYEHLTLTIEEAEERRIRKVKVFLNKKTEKQN